MLNTDVPNMMGSWYTIQIDSHVRCGKYPGITPDPVGQWMSWLLHREHIERDFFGSKRSEAEKTMVYPRLLTESAHYLRIRMGPKKIIQRTCDIPQPSNQICTFLLSRDTFNICITWWTTRYHSDNGSIFSILVAETTIKLLCSRVF